MSDYTIRTAGPADIPALIELVEIATGGFITHVIAGMSGPGQDDRSFLAAIMQDPTSQLFHEKARVAEVAGAVAGLVMTETIADPADLTVPDAPAVLQPLLALENLAPGTRLINFVAVYPVWRGQGLGTALMECAEQDRGPNGMSLTIHDQNTGARQLYERLGYHEVARCPIVRGSWKTAATEWVLMVKP